MIRHQNYFGLWKDHDFGLKFGLFIAFMACSLWPSARSIVWDIRKRGSGNKPPPAEVDKEKGLGLQRQMCDWIFSNLSTRRKNPHRHREKPADVCLHRFSLSHGLFYFIFLFMCFVFIHVEQTHTDAPWFAQCDEQQWATEQTKDVRVNAVT